LPGSAGLSVKPPSLLTTKSKIQSKSLMVNLLYR
jgi:hypothetical protein